MCSLVEIEITVFPFPAFAGTSFTGNPHASGRRHEGRTPPPGKGEGYREGGYFRSNDNT